MRNRLVSNYQTLDSQFLVSNNPIYKEEQTPVVLKAVLLLLDNLGVVWSWGHNFQHNAMKCPLNCLTVFSKAFLVYLCSL